MTRTIPDEATRLEKAYALVQELERMCRERIVRSTNEILYGNDDMRKEEIIKLRTIAQICNEFLLVIEEYMGDRDD